MDNYVNTFFHLEDVFVDELAKLKPEFGYDGYGEIIYYRTYSRKRPKDSAEAVKPRREWTGQENWHDTVLRVINGTFSIRKDHYERNRIPWDEDRWQSYAYAFGKALFKMQWLPPGRGLWAMGTQFVYERGSMALYNCAFTNLTSDDLADDLEWLMDSLMVGVGVGWYAIREPMKAYNPVGNYYYDIGDTREEWAKSVRLLVEAFTHPNTRLPIFRYHLIREKGKLIEGFGGLASGPEPLRKLHEQIKALFVKYMTSNYDIVQLKSDLANIIGCCVVAGNVRRSAEIGLGWITDVIFRDLKDYEKYPERAEFGWMSNNTVMCESDDDFTHLGEVAKRVIAKGEPGVANLRNFKKGRLNGKKNGHKDKARGANPCGEITLEHRETCNVVETLPTNCPTVEEWYRACEFATFYASTVSLLPTHQPSTNSVVTRNRRIGVGIIDYTGWVEAAGQHNIIRYLRKGYDIVSSTNQHCNAEAGVPEAIKKTTIKPGGTVPKLPGKTSGAGFATFTYTLRRTRIAANHPMVALLREANVPLEPLIGDEQNTLVFGYPITQSGRTADEVTIWEQAMNIVTLQREWADNSVSNTIYFKPRWKLLRHSWDVDEFEDICDNGNFELDDVINAAPEKVLVNQGNKVEVGYGVNGLINEMKLYCYDHNHEEEAIEKVLSMIMPVIKMVSFLPHSNDGVYKQMPESGLTEAAYSEMVADIGDIDWTNYHGSDGEDEKYCNGASCEIPTRR